MNQETEFLQSEEWLRFQEAAGKKVVRLSGSDFSANGIVHTLPIVGRYLYVPRGPIVNENIKYQISNIKELLVAVARKENARWIRIEPQAEAMLAIFQKAFGKKLVKAPHDMQPRETFVIDISKNEEELLAAMKPKTRYNVRLAEKHGVKVFSTREEKHRQVFLDLMQTTADRQEITPHPRAYYEKFLTAFPDEMCQLFVAEYGGQVLAANLLMIYGTTATYLHGGSSGEHREMMAPYLLQWEQMRYAKAQGCARYDFGGIRTTDNEQRTTNNTWTGITRFKMGFSPKTAPVVFPGAYDIILDSRAYALYDHLRRLQESFRYIKKFLNR